MAGPFHVFLFKVLGQIKPHEVRSFGKRGPDGYLDTTGRPLKFAALNAGPYPRRDANEVPDEVFHGSNSKTAPIGPSVRHRT